LFLFRDLRTSTVSNEVLKVIENYFNIQINYLKRTAVSSRIKSVARTGQSCVWISRHELWRTVPRFGEGVSPNIKASRISAVTYWS